MTLIHLAQPIDQWRVVGCFEHGNEYSVDIRCREYLVWFCTYKLLNKGICSMKLAKFS